MITKEELTALAGVETSPVVSIYLPTHEKSREVRQDPIRMRNALNAAAEQLAALGQRKAEADELLEPARALLDDDQFWRHQGQGLAVFVAPGLFQAHRLPLEVAEAQHVGPRPHIKPLLPMLTDDGRFYVLTAQAADAKLYLGSRHGLTEVEADIPRSVAEVSAETDFEPTAHAAPPARPRVGSPVGMPASHGFGEAPEEQRKAQLQEHLRRLQSAVGKELAGAHTVPVVLVAQPEIQGHLRALAKDVNLLEEGVQKDPSAMKEGEIHERAYELVRPLFAQAREKALDRFRALAGSNDARASTDLRAVVSGARYQRVDTLFVAEGEEVWGAHVEADDTIRTDREATPENEDLLDYAALHTILNGGPVHVLPRAEMPAEAPACAIFRF